MLLYVIRHADPIYNPDCLTEKGKRQAEALARRLSVNGLDKIYSSPMIRAQQTAQPTCELLGLKPEILDFVSEEIAWNNFTFPDPEIGGNLNWCFGIQTTRYKTPEMLAMGDNWYDAEPFCLTNIKQAYQELQQKSNEFMASHGYVREGMNYRIERPNDDRIAVFCHQAIGTTWLAHLLAVPPVIFWSTFDVNHSGITIIEFKNNKDGYTAPKCLAVSDTSHLYADRLPLKFANGIDL